LTKYNEDLSQSQQLTREDVIDLSNELHRRSLFMSADIPSSIKLQAIQQHREASRAQEEIIRLKHEMEVCVNSYISRYHNIDNKIKELESI